MVRSCACLISLLLLLVSSCNKQPRVPAVVNYPDYHKKNLGASSGDLLSSKNFTSLTVEIQYVEGFRPETATIDSLSAFLTKYLDKPAGIKIVMSRLMKTGRKTMSKDEIAAIEDSTRHLFPTDKNLTLYLLFTDGAHPDKNILGMAYRNTSAVMFGGSIAANSGANHILTKAELETSVLLHEVGHLMGLGNPAGTAMSRKAGRGKHGHCNNKMCLMYWATETRNRWAINHRGRVPQLGRECVDLIEQIKGGREPGGKIITRQ